MKKIYSEKIVKNIQVVKKIQIMKTKNRDSLKNICTDSGKEYSEKMYRQ